MEVLLSEPTNFAAPHHFQSSVFDEIAALARRFEDELRRSKRNLPQCGEILLPQQLSRQVATDILRLANAEPYGLRGCTIYIGLECAAAAEKIVPPPHHVRFSTVHCDPTIPDTFELYLTLKEVLAPSWNHFLPQFLKKFARGGTVVISTKYDLRKRKLYRSCEE